jgi:hypothetical protein
MSSLLEKIRTLFKKKRGLTPQEKKAQLDQLHTEFYNSEGYVVASITFHYKNNNSHKSEISLKQE